MCSVVGGSVWCCEIRFRLAVLVWCVVVGLVGGKERGCSMCESFYWEGVNTSNNPICIIGKRYKKVNSPPLMRVIRYNTRKPTDRKDSSSWCSASIIPWLKGGFQPSRFPLASVVFTSLPPSGYVQEHLLVGTWELEFFNNGKEISSTITPASPTLAAGTTSASTTSLPATWGRRLTSAARWTKQFLRGRLWSKREVVNLWRAYKGKEVQFSKDGKGLVKLTLSSQVKLILNKPIRMDLRNNNLVDVNQRDSQGVWQFKRFIKSGYLQMEFYIHPMPSTSSSTSDNDSNMSFSSSSTTTTTTTPHPLLLVLEIPISSTTYISTAAVRAQVPGRVFLLHYPYLPWSRKQIGSFNLKRGVAQKMLIDPSLWSRNTYIQ